MTNGFNNIRLCFYADLPCGCRESFGASPHSGVGKTQVDFPDAIKDLSHLLTYYYIDKFITKSKHTCSDATRIVRADSATPNIRSELLVDLPCGCTTTQIAVHSGVDMHDAAQMQELLGSLARILTHRFTDRFITHLRHDCAHVSADNPNGLIPRT